MNIASIFITLTEINHETHYVLKKDKNAPINKGNKKVTELRTILQRESQNS